MKKYFYGLLIALVAISFTSCATVDSGHKGVEKSWGGEINMDVIYPEGIDWGIHWLWDDMIEYDVRERSLVQVFEFNDNNNMLTKVEVTLDYKYNAEKVNILHSNITDVDVKIVKTLKSAGKEVVPQYSAVDLNISKRTEAEDMLENIVQNEMPEFYMEAVRVQITDVDIPPAVAKLAEETAVQLGKNELAGKMKEEQEKLADAKVATAQGNYDAGVLDAKTKKLLSTPDQLQLRQLEVDMEWAKQGVSKYGENNVFGAETAIIKGLK